MSLLHSRLSDFIIDVVKVRGLSSGSCVAAARCFSDPEAAVLRDVVLDLEPARELLRDDIFGRLAGTLLDGICDMVVDFGRSVRDLPDVVPDVAF